MKKTYTVYTIEDGKKIVIAETEDLRLAYLLEAQHDNAEIQYN